MKANKNSTAKSAQNDALLPLLPAARRAATAKINQPRKQANAYGGPTGPNYHGGPTGPNYEVDSGLVALLQSTYVSPAGVSLGLLLVGRFFSDTACDLPDSDRSKAALAKAAEHLFALSVSKAIALK